MLTTNRVIHALPAVVHARARRGGCGCCRPAVVFRAGRLFPRHAPHPLHILRNDGWYLRFDHRCAA